MRIFDKKLHIFFKLKDLVYNKNPLILFKHVRKLENKLSKNHEFNEF
tara:strand:- start:205 stop:345 length:141 start_codon:yes stop_codon:yes gene_type:complete